MDVTKTIFTAQRLYGRCLELHVGAEVIEVKVMGDRTVAAAHRELLLAALADQGVTVKEDKQ